MKLSMSATLRERRNLTDGYPVEVALLKATHGLALAIVKLYWTQMAPDSPPERLQVIERCSTS